jgi:zinc protease
VGLFIPTDKPDRAEIPSAPDVASLVKDYRGDAAAAVGEAFDRSPANIDARTVRCTLPAGMKLAFLPKKTRGNDVSALIRLHFGDVKSLAGRSPAALLVGQMLMRGTQKHSRQQIQDELDKLKAEVYMWGGASGANASIQTTGSNLPAVLKLVAEILREPSFPDNEFEPVRQIRLSGDRGESERTPVPGAERIAAASESVSER